MPDSSAVSGSDHIRVVFSVETEKYGNLLVVVNGLDFTLYPRNSKQTKIAHRLVVGEEPKVETLDMPEIVLDPNMEITEGNTTNLGALVEQLRVHMWMYNEEAERPMFLVPKFMRWNQNRQLALFEGMVAKDIGAFARALVAERYLPELYAQATFSYTDKLSYSDS